MRRRWLQMHPTWRNESNDDHDPLLRMLQHLRDAGSTIIVIRHTL